MFGSTTILITIIIVTVSILFYNLHIKSINYWKRKRVPYIKPIPIIGNILEVLLIRTTMIEYVGELYKMVKDEPFFGIWMLNKPKLIVKDPNIIKHVLIKDFHNFQNRSIINDEKADPLASKVLFFLHNPEWKLIRQKISPIFTLSKLKGIFYLIEEIGDKLTAKLDTLCKNGSNKYDAKDLSSRYSIDVLTSCAFGLNGNSLKYDDDEFRLLANRLFNFTYRNSFRAVCYFFLQIFVKIFKITFFEEINYDFIRKKFLDTIKNREETGIKRKDIIDVIIQLKEKVMLNDEIKFEGDRVVAQAGMFFAAGFETTSSTMAFALYELCLQPEIQEKLREEINENSKLNKLSYDNVMSLKYLDMVLCETLRKYPVTPFLDRACLDDYKIPGTDIVIEKGTPVLISTWGLHYDPKFFPNPEKFDPERFSDENEKRIQSCTYIPFGEGPRNCIGERFGTVVVKYGLLKIISNYKIEAIEETPIPIKFNPKSFILQSTVGLPMRFIKI